MTVINPLIPTHVGVLAHQEQTLVNARDLHRFLESRQDFSDWIKKRINEYGFIQGADYLIHKFMERENQSLSGWKTPVDYHLSLDMAKELAMVEKTDKGRMVRRYFIELEQQALIHHADRECLIEALKDAVCTANPLLQKTLRYKGLGLSNVETAKLIGVSPATVDRAVKRLASLELLPHQQVLRVAGAQLPLLEG